MNISIRRFCIPSLLVFCLCFSSSLLATTAVERIQELDVRIAQITAEIKTANQNKEREKAKDLQNQRKQLQAQVRDLRQQAREEKKATDQQAKRAAAEREWETYPADKQLCTAIEYNRADLVKRVLDSGAIDLQKPNTHCLFPLGDAAARGHLDIAEQLLKKNSPLAIQVPQFLSLVSAMDSAAAHTEDRTAMLDLLKKYGATATDSKSASIPGATVTEGDQESQEILKQKYNVSGDQLSLGSSLPRALEKGHVNNIRWLLAQGANPEETQLGRTALMIAVDSNSLEKVKVLVDAGADVNTRGMNFTSVLHYAEKRHARVGAKSKAHIEEIIAYLKAQGATKSDREQ